MRSKILEKQVATVQTQGLRLAEVNASAVPVLHEPPPRPLIRQTGRFHLLPRSFRDFVTSHNGWESFWSGFSLRGITGEHTARAVDDILTRAKRAEAASKQTQQADLWDENHVCLANHPIIGTDFSGQLLLFDIRRVDQRGENPVLLWNDQRGVVRTFPTLLTMLEQIADEQHRELAELPGSKLSPEQPDRRQKILEALRRVRARRRQQERDMDTETEMEMDYEDHG